VFSQLAVKGLKKTNYLLARSRVKRQNRCKCPEWVHVYLLTAGLAEVKVVGQTPVTAITSNTGLTPALAVVVALKTFRA
jgi:hypothetical protein